MKICILGFGGIARSHAKGYLNSEKAGSPDRLTAICDVRPERFDVFDAINIGDAGKLDLSGIAKYTDWRQMLETEQPDIVDICLPTYLHCEFACEILQMGYHVQCEKPMALTKADCDKMIAAAQKSGKTLFIGMTLRFEPLYMELKKMVDDGRFGKVRSAHFDRLSGLPKWSFENWFHDYSKSGGVALDMHIHDVDMVRCLFGEPEAVTAAVVDAPHCKCITISSRFHYPDKLITAYGDWGQSDSCKFAMRYRVNFEHATVLSDAAGIITVCPNDGEPYEHLYEHRDRMQTEELYMAALVRGKVQNTVNTVESAARDVYIVEKLMESAAKDGEKVSV